MAEACEIIEGVRTRRPKEIIEPGAGGEVCQDSERADQV